MLRKGRGRKNVPRNTVGGKEVGLRGLEGEGKTKKAREL
jgi:hypothetical protein